MIWITWEHQRRNFSFSAALGAQLFVFEYKNHLSITRYILSSLRTLLLFLRKEKIFFVQNPSIILALLAVFMRKTFRRDILLFIDTHNAGLFPFDGRYRFLNGVTKLIVTNADYVIVTNTELASKVTEWGGNAVIAEDPLPSIQRTNYPIRLIGDKNILFICSFSEDEPYEEVVKACFLLDKGMVVYMTGKVRDGCFGENPQLPSNLVVTNFISQSEFDNLLLSVDCVLVLTTRENCLVCGGYEATAATKPLILSDTKMLKSFFYKGAVYCENDHISIARAIHSVYEDINRYNDEISNLKKEINLNWQTRKKNILHLINSVKSD